MLAKELRVIDRQRTRILGISFRALPFDPFAREGCYISACGREEGPLGTFRNDVVIFSAHEEELGTDQTRLLVKRLECELQ